MPPSSVRAFARARAHGVGVGVGGDARIDGATTPSALECARMRARTARDARVRRVHACVAPLCTVLTRFLCDSTAMTGKDCVAIASDLRLGINQNQTTAVDYSKLHKIHDKLYLGLTGLISDQLTFIQKMRFKHEMYELRENRVMSPKVFGAVVSAALYEKRFSPYYTEPVIAGLDKDGKPYITSMDLIGADASTDDFVVAGDNVESLLGGCETFYRANLEPEELFTVISNCLMSGVNRDCLSGWGGVVTVIHKDGSFTRTLKGRMD